jgi:DNA-binding NarL/FixJ family response regulator
MIRLFVIEDHPVVLSGLRNLFRPSRDNIEIAGTAKDVSEATSLATGTPFDIFILDLWIPGSDPVDNLAVLKRAFPHKPVIIYTQEQSFHWQQKMFKHGVSAYIIKSAERDEIKSILEQVSTGLTVYSKPMEQFEAKTELLGLEDPVYGLTSFQKQVILRLTEGHSTKDISRIEHKSVSLIQKTVKHIREIFNAKNNLELVKILMQQKQ